MRFFIINLFCIYSTSSLGQNMTIKSVSLNPVDKTATTQVCLDNNGDTCAMLKIKTDNLEGIEFSNPNQYNKMHILSYQIEYAFLKNFLICFLCAF